MSEYRTYDEMQEATQGVGGSLHNVVNVTRLTVEATGEVHGGYWWRSPEGHWSYETFMTSPDEGPGMTLEELLGDIDEVMGDQ